MKPRVNKTVSVTLDLAERMQRAQEQDPAINWTALAVRAWEAELARRERKR